MGMVDEFSYEELKESIERLSRTISELLELFRTAAQDMRNEPTIDASEVSDKLDKLVEQNKKIAEAITTLLELHKEHLPRISRQTAIQPLQIQPPLMHPRPRFRLQRPALPRQMPQRVHSIQQAPMPQPQQAKSGLDFSLPPLPEEKTEGTAPFDFKLPDDLKEPSIPPPPRKKRGFL
jgi:hypothetical protein